jgi:hypothetical protein
VSDERITRIGSCVLTVGPGDEVIGYWRKATCAEWSVAVAEHGGLRNLHVWSGFTNMEYSDLGPPFMFTEWGTTGADGRPVVADGGDPHDRANRCSYRGVGQSCRMTHAVFVPFPKRIQLRRTKGWSKPVGAIVVSRPSRWGNPFSIKDFPARGVRREGYISLPERRQLVVDCFRSLVEHGGAPDDGVPYDEVEGLAALRGHDLACWCPLDQPCHADVLLELANAEVTT